MIGPTPTVEYRFSRFKLLLLVLVGVPGTAFVGILTWRLMDMVDKQISDGSTSYLSLAVVVILAVMFGVTTLSGVLLTGRRAWHLLFTRGPVVTLSPQGFHDRRLAAEVIPWSSIRRVWKGRRSRLMMIAIEPSVERVLSLTPIASVLYIVNRLILIRGHVIWTIELKRGAVPIYDVSVAYAGQVLLAQLKIHEEVRRSRPA